LGIFLPAKTDTTDQGLDRPEKGPSIRRFVDIRLV